MKGGKIISAEESVNNCNWIPRPFRDQATPGEISSLPIPNRSPGMNLPGAVSLQRFTSSCVPVSTPNILGRIFSYKIVPVITVIKFDENEVKTFVSIIQGEFRTEQISFFEDGSPHIVHFYQRIFLYRIITYNKERSSTWKIIEESDQSYRIEYKDASGNIYRTEFYTSGENLFQKNLSKDRNI